MYNKKDYNSTLIKVLENMIIRSNIETREHICCVRRYAEIIAYRYSIMYPSSRLTQNRCELIADAARIHDIGKISVQDMLLHKKGRLSVFEFDLYKKHTIKGGQMIKAMFADTDKEFERICYNICVYHHEKFDGSGYPYGLKNDKIPLEAQIVGLADMYDTLLRCTNVESFTRKRIFNMLINDECGAISPRLKLCFEKSLAELEKVKYVRKAV